MLMMLSFVFHIIILNLVSACSQILIYSRNGVSTTFWILTILNATLWLFIGVRQRSWVTFFRTCPWTEYVYLKRAFNIRRQCPTLSVWYTSIVSYCLNPKVISPTQRHWIYVLPFRYLCPTIFQFLLPTIAHLKQF